MPTLLCLHGWGGSRESFTELRAALEESEIQILTPDLPGFGTQAEPESPWTTDKYADWVQGYIDKHVQGDYLLLGHSHGGRIAIKLLTRDAKGFTKPTHLYLCASAGIRHPRHFKRIIGLTLAKTGKVLLSIPGLKILQPIGKKLLYKLVRVHDYEKASPVMQETLILVSREDLKPELSKIDIPTNIFWGIDDGMTPISDAYVMQEQIPDSALFTFENTRHAVHRHAAGEIAEVIRKDAEL